MRADVPKRMLLISFLLLIVLLPARGPEPLAGAEEPTRTGSFNHENYGSYVTNQSTANFGQPAANSNAQYFPRVLQFGVRATF